MPPPAPFFIIGTERSGSNLLRLILNSHPALCVPHPPHILKYFAPLAAGYGNLAEPERLARLVADVRGLIGAHIHPWEEIPSQAEILAAVKAPSLVGVFFAVYDCCCRGAGKTRWGCKSTFVIDHLEAVLAACPEARLIWLVRDPRDVAASSRRSLFSPCHPWLTARLWRRQQAAGQQGQAAHPENFLLLRYEELLAAPEATLRQLCAFLGEDFAPAMLEFHRTVAAQRSSSLSACWENTGQPIRSDNFGRYRNTLSRSEIGLVEAAGGELMAELGYPRETAADATGTQPGRWRRGWFSLQDCYWRLGVELRAWRRDRNYRLHWRRRLFLLRLRLTVGWRRMGHAG
ncbi:MAG: sulfotransferase [Desulfobulbaceae bacterium]|nr:sulfotransferase [Desulfobulbaceae bacterium]